MAIVNFNVPKALEGRIVQVVKRKGFASKAEFFRFAAIQYMDLVNKPFVSEEERRRYVAGELTKEIRQRFRHKKILSAREQLADL